MRYSLLLILTILISVSGLLAQNEFNISLRVNVQQIQTADPKIFETLEKDLEEFLNGRYWTEDRFQPEERINCNIIMTLIEGDSPDAFEADIAIQSSRPVYMSGNETAVFNTLDPNVDFFYEQFQAIQFSEQSFTGNLPVVLAYYLYMVLGFDYDTFSPLGGQRYFEKAQEIINRLPADIAESSGWKSSPTRNRFWLLENVLSPRVLPLRRALYTYHREGLDIMHEDPNLARANISLALNDVKKTNQNYPNSMIVQAFVDAKREEIIEIFKGATVPEQNTVIQAMSQIDRANAGKYRDIRSRGGSANVRRSTTNGRSPARASGSAGNNGLNRSGSKATTKGKGGK